MEEKRPVRNQESTSKCSNKLDNIEADVMSSSQLNSNHIIFSRWSPERLHVI